MSNDAILSQNKKNVEERINTGLNMLKEYYEVIPVDTKEFSNIQIQQMKLEVRQYEVKGVGNLSILVCLDSGTVQMDTFVLTPYFKNIPMISTDYMYMNDNRTILNEVYGLVAKKDSQYEEYIKKFADVREKYASLPDIPAKEEWYDHLRTVYSTKQTTADKDKEILTMFKEYLDVLVDMEQAFTLLPEEERVEKWKITQNYVKELADKGGVSTNMFKMVLGAEKTSEFFENVFFGTKKFSQN